MGRLTRQELYNLFFKVTTDLASSLAERIGSSSQYEIEVILMKYLPEVSAILSGDRHWKSLVKATQEMKKQGWMNKDEYY
jgi:hypothetical protein